MASQQRPMEGKRGPCLPLEKRIRLHSEVLQLRRQGLSYSKIIQRIHRLRGVRLYDSLVSYWVCGVHSPLGKVNRFEAEPSPTLAYIIGVKASDGYAYNYKKIRRSTVELGVTDYDFAAETGRKLAELLGRKKPYQPWWDKWHHYWRVSGYSVLLYPVLGQPIENMKSYVEHCADCVASFLRGFFDGEGGISGRALTVYNTNKELLFYVQELLRRYFGIDTTGPHKGTEAGKRFRNPKNGKICTFKKNCYYLYVPVDCLSRFHRYIGFTINRKQRRLIEALQN